MRFLPARPANLVPDGGWGWPPFEGTMYVCHDILEVGMLVRVKMMRMLTLSICGAIRRSQGRWPDRMNWISTYQDKITKIKIGAIDNGKYEDFFLSSF